MIRRRTCFALFMVFLGVAVSLALVQFSQAGSDEARYRRSVRNMRLAGSIRQKCQWLPHSLGRALDGLTAKPFDKYHVQEKALLDSGFLTNLSVTLSNASASFGKSNYVTPAMASVSQRIHSAVRDDDWLPFSLCEDVESNRVSVEVLCRAKDVPFVAKALEGF